MDGWVDGAFGRVFRRAASRLCVSPYMAELYGRQIFTALEKFDSGARVDTAAETKATPAEETMPELLMACGQPVQTFTPGE